MSAVNLSPIWDLTVSIAAGYGRFAACTLAADDRISALERLAEDFKNLLQVIYHAHVKARMSDPSEAAGDSGLHTIRGGSAWDGRLQASDARDGDDFGRHPARGEVSSG